MADPNSVTSPGQTAGFGARLWVTAVAAALSLHIGVATAAFVLLSPGPDDEDVGATAIDISMEPAAPPVEDAPDLPPGPLSDESTATPPSVAPHEAQEQEAPKITPVESEDADLARSVEPQEKPVEDQPPAPETPAVASMPSEAAEATAPPKSEVATEAPVPVAPVVSTDNGTSKIKATWQKALMVHLNRNKRFPTRGKRHSAEVDVAFTLDRLGHVVTASIVKSSGDPTFDEAALAMMKRADPVPAPPPALADEGLSFEMPVIFRVPGR
jgi:TonB family protein